MKLEGSKKFNLSDYNELVDLSDYKMSIRQIIMAKCKECCGFSSHEAVLCKAKDCALYRPYQFYVKNSKVKQRKDSQEA